MEPDPSLINAPAGLDVDAAIARARRFSRYLDRLLTAEPQLLEGIDLCTPLKVAFAPTDIANAMTREALQRVLRGARKKTIAALIIRDLAGWANLAEVTQTMTRLAASTINAALEWVTRDLAQTLGSPQGSSNAIKKTQQLHVIGMGKLGGGELNVSSDIDLVFIYPEDGDTDGARVLSNHEYFSRAGRALIGLLAELTADGFVFRVDMRLRPYGDSGPLVASFDMLENYLITQGREWERYAWIKGRVLTGDQGDELMALVRPFVFRRHLDFSAFASMRELHSQIRREVERRDHADNIKLGRGGIREIEFIAQVFQLIRGGHDAALRRQPTLDVLALLAERGLLPAPAVMELTQAYVFLRNLEHRLQYLDDQQTHALPPQTEDQTRIAHSMAFADYTAFMIILSRHRETVARHFDQLFAQTSSEQHALAPLWANSSDAASGITRLGELGFQRAAELQSRIAYMHDSARYRQMPAGSQSRFDRLMPLAIESAAAGRNADVALERLLVFLEGISRRESYLALLEEYPQAREQLTALMRASPWVAQYLTQHPILLDELLDSRTLHTPPDWPALAALLRSSLIDTEGDTERQMDVLRHFKHAQTLRLVAQDLADALPLETLSDHLSDLACVVLAETVRLAWQGVRQRHRPVPAFTVIGYGKLGGKELGYASDLDLVFLYDDDAPEAAENYARLAQRISTWLTSTTPAGQLYDTDLRLRPDGESGLLVSSLARFREYQLAQAWVWEHQALTRARCVAGDTVIGSAFDSIRNDVLRRPRASQILRGEITAMRKKMHAAHPNRSGLFDVKHDSGGIVDVEFIVQYLVLGHAHQHAALTGNIGNLALLKLAAQLNLIDEPQANAAYTAYREFRRLQHTLRLQGEAYARVPHESVSRHTAAVRALWQQVMAIPPLAKAAPAS
ncbi:MAG: bifunctional [glutamate--ammonia ligase]-adenylyl-L-tyrosine phosphorylase/[glutamate--ammonia-ligase] adenylyltransferase [Burkholderiales bacterium]